MSERKEKTAEELALMSKELRYYYKHRDKCAADNKAWIKANRKHKNQTVQTWKKKNPERRKLICRKYQLKKKFGLTLEDYDMMVKEQSNCCALCGEPFTQDRRGYRPHIDHDHKTGKVRGLLHSNCNTMLGLAHEDTVILKKAIAYLEKH